MNFAFVCSEGDKLDEDHSTTGAMVKCAFCGYMCDDCDHEDLDQPDQLWGHGPGKCVADGEAATCPDCKCPCAWHRGDGCGIDCPCTRTWLP